MTDKKKNILTELLRKNSLLISALALSVILMFVFKKNNVTSILNDKSTFLSNLELIDFRPLFDDKTLTNEEVFHFLMHNQIPLDGKKDRVLKIQERSPSVYSYNIRTADYKKELDSYENFLSYLRVTDDEKKEIDKILHECGGELSTNILKGNKDELAISPKLVSIRQKTLIKLFSYLSEIRPSLTDKVFPPDYLHRKHMEEIALAHSAPERFLILTPDTVVIAERKNTLGNTLADKGKNQISVTVSDEGEATVKMEICDTNQNENDSLGIEWYKILPTHSKIVFTESGVTLGEDSLTNYLKQATALIKQFDIKIFFDSTNQEISWRGKNDANRIMFNSAAGLQHLEKMFNSGFNFGEFANVDELERIGTMIDSLTRAYDGNDSVEWAAKMNEAIKEFEKRYSASEKEEKK